MLMIRTALDLFYVTFPVFFIYMMGSQGPPLSETDLIPQMELFQSNHLNTPVFKWSAGKN